MDYYIGDSSFSAAGPHYVTTTVSDWRQLWPTRQAAQHWIDTYGATQSYKEQSYRIISKVEFWNRRNGY